MKFKDYAIKSLAFDYKVSIKGLDIEQLKKGLNVEKEHTGGKGKDTIVAKNDGDILKIAVAHLREDPKYYSKLEKIEENVKPKLIGIYYYSIIPELEDRARILGLEKTLRKNWGLKVYDTSGEKTRRRIEDANKYFGKGKWWGIRD